MCAPRPPGGGVTAAACVPLEPKALRGLGEDRQRQPGVEKRAVLRIAYRGGWQGVNSESASQPRLAAASQSKSMDGCQTRLVVSGRDAIARAQETTVNRLSAAPCCAADLVAHVQWMPVTSAAGSSSSSCASRRKSACALVPRRSDRSDRPPHSGTTGLRLSGFAAESRSRRSRQPNRVARRRCHEAGTQGERLEDYAPEEKYK
jgi:hypothetical protein